MSKLSFRARALDAGKPMPIYMAEDLPDLPDYSAINRAVPQMPSGMEKEEECEHHLQRAICTGIIIPTPEVSDMPEKDAYDRMYPANYKQPRQLIHMQPFTMEQDIPDYDMDSEDERWLMSQTQRLELSPLKFEEMMDRLEKSSGQTVVTLHEAKALLKEDDDLIIAVYDYWLNKRLKLQHPLILSVKTEHRIGTAANNPYLAFRRRTEKMQTRKNRKNDETSYEKMLKLRRDLCRAVTLLELVKRREKIKREYVHLTVEIFEKRYQARDFSGAMVAEMASLKATRPAFTPIFHNHYGNQGWSNKAVLKDEIIPRKEKRQYKKRKHKSLSHTKSSGLSGVLEGVVSSDEEAVPQTVSEPEEVEEEGPFAFRRNKLCSYHMPVPTEGNWPWASPADNGLADKKYRYALTSLRSPRRCVGFARRRLGRGGRVILDRAATDLDDFWRTCDFTIYDNARTDERLAGEVRSGAGRIADDARGAIDPKSGDVRLSSDGFGWNGVKTELNGDCLDRWRTSETNSEFVTKVKEEVKEEAEESERRFGSCAPKEEMDEMVEFLKTVRRDWLHFRPKTPPPDYEPPCHLLPADDPLTAADLPFSLELQAPFAPGAFPDATSFVAGPFTLDDAVDDVPVTDTRQVAERSDGEEDETTVGCSRFSVRDGSGGKRREVRVESTLTSPRLNSVEGKARGAATEEAVGSANGLWTQFALNSTLGCKTKNNKKPYAYQSGVSYSNAPTSTLSLHTSAHTLTLNSHSANILEIPLTADAADKVPSKVATAPDAGAASPPAKSKAIVRKNNLVMEVT